MATDDERRREAARRLREFTKNNQWPLTVGGNSTTIRYAISDIVFGDKKYHSGVDLLDRLADLIEPAPTSSDTAPTCDREALLALADEMGHPIKQAVWNQTAGVRREHIMAEYARRIREACGEVAS